MWRRKKNARLSRFSLLQLATVNRKCRGGLARKSKAISPERRQLKSSQLIAAATFEFTIFPSAPDEGANQFQFTTAAPPLPFSRTPSTTAAGRSSRNPFLHKTGATHRGQSPDCALHCLQTVKKLSKTLLFRADDGACFGGFTFFSSSSSCEGCLDLLVGCCSVLFRRRRR